MALNKTFQNKDGGTSNGYYRVREVGTQYEKDKDGVANLSATFFVEVYDEDAKQVITALYKYPSKDSDPAEALLEVPVKTWQLEGAGAFSLALPDGEPVQNLIVKAYEHLKTLPEFNGATDC